MPAQKVAISVVIPTYNRAGFIVETLRSVFAQTFRDHEVVVVDDGSRDGTRKVLEPWIGRIRYVRQENRGAAAARNRGIAEARGEWVAFLDSDDIWEPQALKSLHRAAEAHPEAGMITMRARRLYADGTVGAKSVGKKSPGAEITAASLLWGDGGAVMSPMVRRDLLLAAGGYDEGLTSAEDCDLALRLSFRTTIIGLPEAHLLVRIHPGSDNLSADKAQNARMWIRSLENLSQDQPEFVRKNPWVYRRALGKERLRLGRELLARCDGDLSMMGEARRSLTGSIRSFPFFLRAWIYCVASYLAPRPYAAWRRLETRWARAKPRRIRSA